MSQDPVFCPLSELHLGHQLGLDPMHSFCLRADGRVVKRRRGRLDFFEPFKNFADRPFAEARANPAAVREFSFHAEYAYEQRAKAFSPGAGFGISAYDELLALMAFYFYPAFSAPLGIGTVLPLGDDALYPV